MPIEPTIVNKIILAILNGVVWALIIALVALGLTLIFGLMDIVNIAHGDFYMLGAVLAWYGVALFNNFWLGAVMAMIFTAILGAVVERSIIRPVEGLPAFTVVVTIGLSYIIQQSVLATFGGSPQTVPEPIRLTIEFLGIRYPAYRLFVAGVSGLALIALGVFLFKTPYGLWIRASMQDKEIASAMGINVSNVYIMTFSLGAMLSALGGALAAPITQVFYLMGLDVLAISFIIVIIGGLGSLKGTLIAAFIISLLENFITLVATPTEARVISLLIMGAVLLIRPKGLFST